MPTKAKITKEMILNAAFEIVKESGIDALTNKALSERLNCSIQPIYYQFKNTEDLKKELLIKIEKYFFEFLTANMTNTIPKYKQIGINYIKFAKEEKELFRIIFMTKSNHTASDLVTHALETAEGLEKVIKNSTELDKEEIKTFHIRMWIFTHGVASLVANETCNLTDEQISGLLSSSFQAFMLLEDNPNNKWLLKEFKSVNKSKVGEKNEKEII